MNNKTGKHDSAFEHLLEARQETNSNDIAIAEHEREIRRLKNKKIKDERNEHILAANYFTRDKICELHEKTVHLLKGDDFDQDEFIKIFANSTTITREHIDFLINRQEELYAIEKKLDNIKHDFKNKKTNGILLALAEVLLGGAANDD